MKTSILFFPFLITTLASFAQTKPPVRKPVVSKYGALAIDRQNGYYYGWSFDYATIQEAESKAIQECNAKGGNCSVVLLYSGQGCAAYRTIDGKVGTAFGWGVAKTKEDADAIATKECLKRSNGINPTNFVWSCNSTNTGSLKEIYNAIDEIEVPVRVGTQVWSNRNMNVSFFRNGDLIPQARTNEEWNRARENKQPAWCFYENDPANGVKYGKLYNWYAVNDPRGLAPVGYHIPSNAEWTILVNYLGGKKIAGDKMKSQQGWAKDGNGTNSSGFSGVPGGYRLPNGSFLTIGEFGNWWSSTEFNTTKAWSCNLGYNRGDVYTWDDLKERGFSVRCLRD